MILITSDSCNFLACFIFTPLYKNILLNVFFLDYCMGSSGKVHCSDKDERCIEFTSIVDPNEVFHNCFNIHTEKTYRKLINEIFVNIQIDLQYK